MVANPTQRECLDDDCRKPLKPSERTRGAGPAGEGSLLPPIFTEKGWECENRHFWTEVDFTIRDSVEEA